MNFKSGILKLSIIFMLVLVLIPVASAMDSEGSFYQEYESSADQVAVEEYSNYEVEYTQADVSSDYDDNYYDSNIEEETEDVPIEIEDVPTSNQENNPCDDDNEDAVEIAELNLNSVDEVTHDIVDQNIDEVEFETTSDEIADNIIDNVYETSEEELKLEYISVNQGSIFISKYDATVNYLLINKILYAEMTTFESTSLNRGFFKVLELKNNLLIKQDLQTTYSEESEIDNLEDIIICISNTSTDFAYSIDNSIIGDEYDIFIPNSCFINFKPCFDAIFCCKLLDFRTFLCGDFS